MGGMRSTSTFFFLAGLALSAISVSASAQQIDYDELAKRPGFTVTRKVVKGEEIVTIRKESVEIEVSSAGTVGMDKDTAVLCLWNEYVKLHVGADYCFPDSERELREDFAEAVERFKDFIVANSLTPITRSALDAFVEKRRTELLSQVPKTPTGAPRCPKTELFVDYQADGREKRRADVAKILAVPRPPVMNPCF
jgi:hypothetical protein